MRPLLPILASVLLAHVLAAPLPAQTPRARLAGVVRDASGAVLPGTRMLLRNEATGWTREARTDARGEYRFAALPPGRYRLRAEAEGFAALRVQGLALTVGEAADLDLVLRVSALEQEVTVEADASLLEREQVVESSALEALAIDSLPSDGRSFLDFTLLTPGVSDRHTLASERPVQAPTSGLSFAGQDQRSVRVHVDGLDGLDDIANSVRPTLSQEAVQEFQISRSSYPAALGGSRGGTINIVSRSGGNRFHGSGFGQWRDQDLDARNTFEKRRPEGPSNRFRRRLFGGSLGGPLAADRTFFFAAYEGRRRRETRFVTFLDDRSIFEPTPGQLELFDVLAASGDPGLAGLASTFVDPSFGLLRTLPTTFPDTLALLESESGAFPFEEDLDIASARFDHQFSAANQAFGRLTFASQANDNTDFGALEGVSNGVRYDVRDWTLAAGDLHVFSPTLLHDLRFQYARRALEVLTQDPRGPEVSIAGLAEFGREFLNPTRYDVDLVQVVDQVTWLRSRHALSAGVELESRQRRGQAEVFLGGQFNFGEAVPLAALLDSVGGPGSAAGLAMLLSAPPPAGLGRPDLAGELEAPLTSLQAYNLGLPLTYLQGFGDPATDVPVHRLALYVQDAWRVHPRLTLSAGLRYQTAWRTETLNLEPGQAPFSFYPAAVNDHDNLEPRLGFAFTPQAGRLVVRGGYGIYHQNLPGALEVTSSVLSGRISQVFLPLTGLPGIPVGAADIWGFMRSTGADGREALAHFGLEPGSTPSIVLPGDPGLVNPYSHQASLSVERLLGSEWSLEAGYLFNSGVHLVRSRDYNVRPLGDGRFGVPGLDPRFVQLPVMETSGNSVYHGLTATLHKRFGSRYALDASYTLGKAIDDTTDFIVELGPQDHTDLRAERALSTFDQRQRLAVSAIFEGPRRLSLRRPLSLLLSDWRTAATVVVSSGKPFNLLAGFDRNGDTHAETDRPLTESGAGVGRNTGRGPGFASTDLRLSRRFRLPNEKGRLEVSCEFFNLFNRVNYSQLNHVVGDTVLETGRLSGSESVPANRPLGFTSAFEPRRLQLGLRFVF